MDNANTNGSTFELKKAYLINPIWSGLFFIIGGVIVILIGVPVRFITGLSAASDQVFAVEALVSGLLTEQVFKYWLKRKLVLAPKVEIPFHYIWPWLCVYFFFREYM
jgi:hypothetical protein